MIFFLNCEKHLILQPFRAMSSDCMSKLQLSSSSFKRKTFQQKITTIITTIIVIENVLLIDFLTVILFLLFFVAFVHLNISIFISL